MAVKLSSDCETLAVCFVGMGKALERNVEGVWIVDAVVDRWLC
jgi:hypothetical protein